ncbi:MAG TPA: glutamate-cysteine ligase family protein, partial [Mariprofundaceae bacterium]|nr:glutamate-cysteine ligase family protein [Mariprofundaceae bacterium]
MTPVMTEKKAALIPFKPSTSGSTGVEMEWMTVDAERGGQIPVAPQLLQSIGETPRIKKELFTSTIEINTGIHFDTLNCVNELSELRQQVLQHLQPMGGSLLSSGTHPFSRWRDQQISDDPRYHNLVERLQWMALRFNIFGIHVHVGMPDGDTCIRVMNQLLPISPVFLAISANSPFWQGSDTGLSSSRVKIFEGLSQGGMP